MNDDFPYPIWIAAHEGPFYGIPSATIRSWNRRGLLLSRGLDPNGRNLYATGDILVLRRRYGARGEQAKKVAA